MKSNENSSSLPLLGIILAIIGILVAIWAGVPGWLNVICCSPTPIEYNGKVLDVNTQQPIVGAEVQFQFSNQVPPIVYTDDNGIYRFSLAVTEAKLASQVIVRKAGYQPYSRNLTLDVANLILEDIRLTPRE